jgi:hypothetical protein
MRNNSERFGANTTTQDTGLPPQLMQAQGTPQLTFIAPTEFVDLPSGGKFYPPTHPLHGKSSIEIKQMTSKEEDILTSKSLIKKGVVLDRLVDAIILDKSIPTDSLLIADKNAIIVAARINAYGSLYETQVTCPECSTKTDYEFDLTEKLEQAEAEQSEKNLELTENGTFFIKLPKTGWTVELRPLTSKDEKVAIKLLGGETKKGEKEAVLSDQLKLMIASIEGTTDHDLIEKAIAVLPAADSRYLRKEYFKAIPQVDLKKTFSCTKCGYENVLEVPIQAEFFWPK